MQDAIMESGRKINIYQLLEEHNLRSNKFYCPDCGVKVTPSALNSWKKAPYFAALFKGGHEEECLQKHLQLSNKKIDGSNFDINTLYQRLVLDLEETITDYFPSDNKIKREQEMINIRSLKALYDFCVTADYDDKLGDGVVSDVFLNPLISRQLSLDAFLSYKSLYFVVTNGYFSKSFTSKRITFSMAFGNKLVQLYFNDFADYEYFDDIFTEKTKNNNYVSVAFLGILESGRVFLREGLGAKCLEVTIFSKKQILIL